LLVIAVSIGVIAAAGVTHSARASTTPVAVATTFTAYAAPEGFPNGHSTGETSIGTVKGTNNALVQMRYTTARVAFDDSVSPPTAAWSNVTPVTNRATYDPILWTDRVTGRTFVTLLFGETNITSFTDGGGTSWTLAEPPISVVGFDHESMGAGPYTTPRADGTYPHATYYCIGLVVATCSRSDDGGLTWGPPIVTGVPPVSGDLVGVHTDDPLGGCSAVHERVVVGPDGAVYVPRNACGSTQGMLVSRDEGTTWNKVVVPGTIASPNGEATPAVAFDGAGRLYFATSSGGRPLIATSTDGGNHWSPPADVGTDFAIRNTEFSMVVAGDAGRAAFAFFGTPTPGDDQSAAFTGVWHLYVSYTFDGGATWETVDATPTDPVHRGEINLNGGLPHSPDNDVVPGNGPDGRPDRILDGQREQFEDYQDATVDGEGRVLVSYPDGCTSAACVAPDGAPADSRDSLGTISRQSSGRRLFAAFDPVVRRIRPRASTISEIRG